MIMRAIYFILGTLILAGIAISARAQQIIIPDFGLDAAIRDALRKPTGPLTLTLLNGLASLVELNLTRNRLTSLSLHSQ